MLLLHTINKYLERDREMIGTLSVKPPQEASNLGSLQLKEQLEKFLHNFFSFLCDLSNI